MNNVQIGKLYKHFKGNIYKVLNIAKCSETLKELVIYQSIETNEIWARPIEMWNEIVNKNQIPRFQLIEENSNTIKTLNMKNCILSLVNEFSGKYGKGGFAKILKGNNLKENTTNNLVIKTKFYGILKDFTRKSIEEKIDNLIKENLISVKKISFGMPVLEINCEIKNLELYEEIKDEIEINEQEDDKNVIKILNLIKNKENIFLTGHAGTGKSYILSKLKEKIKSLTLVSTTGIAAVNIKGQTIHSWAGVGICNLPINLAIEKILKKSTIKNQIKNCKILAVDEVSMLDIKTLEYIDKVLKTIRKSSKPFGGIQVIFIGDFFQLPPVETNEKKYCFESKLWKDFNFKTILLTKNYRQNEENLIKALSNIRINSLDNEDIKLLKSREIPSNTQIENALHIFATNLEADKYNLEKFNNIKSPKYPLIAKDGVIKGNKFIENPKNEKDKLLLERINLVCRAEKEFDLKIGARVMLLINLDFEKGLINGSTGSVEEITNDFILVKFDNGIKKEIEKHDFEFYKNDVLIATRKQFPLRLAYGITIHKSQGMSLDKLVVDCSRIFEKGQAYVALSRIKTLNGLYLKNFHPSKIMVDDIVVDFYNNLKNNP